MNDALFSGPHSLRDPSERVAFWLTAICALPAALLIGYVLHESVGAPQVALFIVIAMVYVTLARGRLLGSSVRVHERQYPRVFAIVKDTCAALEIPMPLVFVREDNFVPVAALGFGEPYALVLSSHWVEVYRDDELAFVIGRELGHIAAGHTRFLSLLSVNGKENPFISLIFGAWLRRCTMTCDKVGLLCCGTMDAAIRAIAVSEFYEFGRKFDYAAFAEQHAEIEADSVSRWGAWLGSDPYATTRIAALRAFSTSPQHAAAANWFARERGSEPPALAAPGAVAVTPKDCAGWWRRFAATAIDTVVVLAIIASFSGSRSETPVIEAIQATPAPHASAKPHASSTPAPAPRDSREHYGPIVVDEQDTGNRRTFHPEFQLFGVKISPTLADPNTASGKVVWFAIYMALLVGLAGQSFGMMIAGLRVITTDFRRPGIWRTIFRYAIVLVLWPVIVTLSLVWRRILLHDRWTRTRLVKVERVVARATGSD